MAKILLLTDFSSGYSRSLLKGIVRYAKKMDNWLFYRMPLYYCMLYGEKWVIDWAKKWKADAIIAQLDGVNINILNDLGIPIIVQNYKERNAYVSNFTGDYLNTGVMAARFFLSRGYKYFAFYGFNDTVWSRERLVGYQVEIEKHGYKLQILSVHDKEHKDGDPTVLSEWLKSLPKPIALFACDDFYALQVSEACNMSNIKIPDDIAILGVDNDELLCNISNPPLSSIALDVENGGYRAGELLNKLITKEIVEPFNIVVDPLFIVHRCSTDKYVVSNKYIHAVMEYIEQNYSDSLSVLDLVNIVPLSRRVLERLFKEETAMTLHQYIQNCRIEHFTHLLLSTDSSLSEIAIQVGFDDCKNLSRVFRKYKNVSPAEYRRKYKILMEENILEK